MDVPHANPPVTLAQLLAHGEWVRALSRSLVADPHTADDLAQQAWVAALERPPSLAGNLRAWWARVVRRRQADHRRGAERRRRHEALAPVRADAPGPDELVARAELRARLAEAVLALPDPYRATLLLQSFEGQSAAAIAALHGVPEATVRTRLQRGIALLRERLLDDAEGNASRLRGRLAALAGSSPLSTASTGGALMATANAKWGLAALALLLAGGATWWAIARGGDAGDLPSSTTGTLPGAAASDGAPRLVGQASDAPSAAVPPSIPGGLGGDGRWVYPALARPAARLEGVVRDEVGALAAGATVELRSFPGAEYALLQVGDDRGVRRLATTGAEGAFAWDALEAGPYALRARRGALVSEWHVVAARATTPVHELRLRAAGRLDELCVRVLDAAGAPVSGADVVARVAGDGRTPLEPGALLLERLGSTDAQGRVVWPDLPTTHFVVSARGPGGLVGLRSVTARGDRWNKVPLGDIDVVVGSPGRISGQVVTAAGGPADAAFVEARLSATATAYSNYVPHAVRTPAVDGAFVFEALPAGEYVLHAGGNGWTTQVEWQQEGRFPYAPPLELAAGGSVTARLVVARGGAVEGRVVGPHGPLAGAWVRATRDPRTGNVPDGVNLAGTTVWRLDYAYVPLPEHPLAHRQVLVDATGAYRIDGLEPGPYRIETSAPGHSYQQHIQREVTVGAPLRLDATLVPAGCLQGAAPGKSYFGVRRPQAEECVALAILPRSGLFTFPGLPPGDYELVMPYWERETVVYARASVVTGRTTWVDLSNTGDFGLKGRVLLAGAPVHDAAVYAGRGEAVRTDRAGGFQLLWDQPWGYVGEDGRLEVRRTGAGSDVGTWTFPFRALATAGVVDLGDLELGTERVRIEVRDADGGPLAARIEVRTAPAAPPDGRQGDAAPAPRPLPPPTATFFGATRDGIYEAGGLLPGVEHLVVARLASGVALQRAFTPPHGPLVFRAPRAGDLSVRVLRSSGAPAVGVKATVRCWPTLASPPTGAEVPAPVLGVDLFHLEGQTDREGRVVFPGVPAGALTVRAQESRGGWMSEPGPSTSTDVYLGVGEQRELELRLP